MLAETTGGCSVLILVATISRQEHKPWRSRSTAGVASWRFIGPLTSSTGVVMHGLLIENRAFVATNAFLPLTAVAGQPID